MTEPLKKTSAEGNELRALIQAQGKLISEQALELGLLKNRLEALEPKSYIPRGQGKAKGCAAGCCWGFQMGPCACPCHGPVDAPWLDAEGQSQARRGGYFEKRMEGLLERMADLHQKMDAVLGHLGKGSDKGPST